MIIQKTTDYDQFKIPEGQRKLDHVKALKNSILEKNLLHICPILVDGDYNVIDGQHRLQAAKELEVPIYYRVENALVEEDMITINTGAKNWEVKNYLHYFVNKKKPQYLFVNEMIEQYDLSLHTFVKRFVRGVSTQCATSSFKSGKLELYLSQEETKEILNKAFGCLEEAKKNINGKVNRHSAMEAFIVLCGLPNYNHSHYLIKIQRYPLPLINALKLRTIASIVEEIIQNHYHYRDNYKPFLENIFLARTRLKAPKE